MAQRKQIEALEKDKVDQSKLIARLEAENEEANEMKKEFLKLKRQRVDLIDK